MSLATNKPILLPIVTVQHDFQSVITDVKEGTVPSEAFWISCYKLNETSVHGKAIAELDSSDRNLVTLKSQNGVNINGQGSYSVSCPSLGISETPLRLPERVFSTKTSSGTIPAQITSFDISPDGLQFATGYNDGTILIQPTRGAKYQNISKPHLATVNSLRFFPSSRVLLTAGADFSLSIVAAEPEPSESPLSPVRTLKGHSRSITDTAIISKGRNVLSCAKDGTIRLWDVSEAKSVRTIGSNKWSPVLGMSLGNKSTTQFEITPNPDGEAPSSPSIVESHPKEIETSDKVVFCALSDGSLEAFDLGTKHSVHRTVVGTQSLNTVSYSPLHHLVATGSIDGIVTVFDTRSFSAPVTSFSRNSACIEDFAFISQSDKEDEVGVVVATEDGLPYVISIRPEGPAVLSELIGSDCDAVRVVRIGSGGEIWTAGDDGIVRRY